MPAQLRRSASAFAAEVETLLRSTALASDDAPSLDIKQVGSSITVRTMPSAPAVLTSKGQPLLLLDLNYRLEIARDGSYLRVLGSAFQIRPTARKSEPLFRYDFLSQPEASAVPTAHLNVYAHRDELLHAMYVSQKSHSYPGQSRDIDASRPRGLHQLHFPLGGTRFRPCLEDILELVINEFGIDTVPGWEEAITVGRISWRHIQLAAAVRDDPETARDALREIGAEAFTNEARLARY